MIICQLDIEKKELMSMQDTMIVMVLVLLPLRGCHISNVWLE